MKEREKKGPTLGIFVPGGRSSRSPNAVSYKQLRNCADVTDANMDFCLHESMGLAQHISKVEGTYVQPCAKIHSTS